MVRGGPEVRFHEGSTRVPPWFHRFHQGSTRCCHGCGVVRTKKSTACCWGYHLVFFQSIFLCRMEPLRFLPFGSAREELFEARAPPVRGLIPPSWRVPNFGIPSTTAWELESCSFSRDRTNTSAKLIHAFVVGMPWLAKLDRHES